MKTLKTLSPVNRKNSFFRSHFNHKEEKSMKKSRIFALALALIMCLSTVAYANDFGPVVTDDENFPVQVAITKILRLPVGTITPEAEFRFNARRISFDDDDSQATRDWMPTLNNLVLNFTAADTGEPDENHIVHLRLETLNLFDGVDFPDAGVYIYEITEIPDTNDHIDDNEPYEILTYSPAVYTLRVYVANTADNTSTYVRAVGAIITHPDNPGQTEGFKVDPTPGGDGDNYDHSQMIFTNDYVKTNGPVDPDRPDPINESTLTVSKTVGGDLGNRSLFFNFTMHALNIPILVEDIPPFYQAYVVETTAEGTRVVTGEALRENADESQIGTDDGGLDFINISTTGPTTFRLRHNQRLVFVNTPVGTNYDVGEAAAVNYWPSVIVTTDSISADPLTTAQANMPLDTGLQFVGERINSAAFTNTRSSVVPTGLNMDNLPFIGLVGLPLLALIGLIVLKARKRAMYR